MDERDATSNNSSPGSVIKQVAHVLDRIEQAVKVGGKNTDLESGAKLAAELLGSGLLPRLEEALRQVVETERRRVGERVAAVGAAEATAVRVWRESGEFVRQTDLGWRVGHLELRLDKKTGRASVLYNGLLVVPPEPVDEAPSLQALVESGKARLAAVTTLSRSEIQAALWDAYHFVSRKSAGSAQSAELREVVDELRLALLRRARGEKQQLAILKLPNWALSWLLDEAFRPAPPVLNGRRLAMRTGTQRETRDMGVRVGAREPGGESQVFCFMQDMPFSVEAQSPAP